MTIIGSACFFVLGVIAGFGFSTILNLLIWTAFWLAVGAVVMLTVDVLMGLGRRACALRGWFRKPRYTGNVVRFTR
jgi:hypothetical protein